MGLGGCVSSRQMKIGRVCGICAGAWLARAKSWQIVPD
jgi:hypothetical protein